MLLRRELRVKFEQIGADARGQLRLKRFASSKAALELACCIGAFIER